MVLSTSTAAPITVLVDTPFDPSAPKLGRSFAVKVDTPFDPSAPKLGRSFAVKVDTPFDPSAPKLGFQVKFGPPTVHVRPTPLWARMRSTV
ncbi:hypothetical protein [Planctomyces sp. SH-PL62]|uniref:hypothetical protein n=1 Tax=Planctomyces sp. SH-PL62 TaxID=1636152 RepID=UPI0012E8BBFE|nr:hypothetical protein [Planctomyces sp. SH-PL62]